MKKVVAVTGSKISAAHTAMAAEALEATADMLGYDIRVERRGPDGTADPLSEVEIRNADVVILATDQPDEQGRFRGKTVHRATPGEAIRHTARLLRNAVGDKDLSPVAELAPLQRVQPEPEPTRPDGSPGAGSRSGPRSAAARRQPGHRTRHRQESRRRGRTAEGRAFRPANRAVQASDDRRVLYDTGRGRGRFGIALSFMFGIDAAKEPGSLAAALMQIGGQAAFALMVPVLSGFIAFSIADRPGLAPGLIGGMLANQIGAGFLGGLDRAF